PASSEFPISVDDFNDFEVVANFDPVSVERMEQKFNVFYNVVSEDDDAEIKECLFSFTLNGKGCNDVCPSILLGINTKAELLNNGASETIYSDDTVSFSHGDVIRQEMNDVSTLINSCVSFIDSDDDKLLKYRLIMPEDEDLCSGAYVKLEKDFTSESVFFTVNNPEDRIYLTEEDEYEFSINFYPPTVAEDFDSDIDNDDIYKATYVLNAYSNDDRNICSIEIEVIQEVQQVNINMTDMLPLFSFSQISDMMSEPVRKVYEIGYHRDDKQWGRFRNMRSNSKKVGDHYVPNENSGTFYFDVDDPTNLTLEQYPDLYLFNSSSSAFNYITSYPVDNFITTDNFVDYQDKLVESVFSTDGFSHDGVNFTFNPGAENGQMWNNSMHASEFSPGNGIPINVGDVFIIWSKDVAGSRISGLNPDDIGGYCKVAFLYISGKHHGKDGENTHHISSVDFNVAYPIQVIQGK
ncbi:MAG TPA: hypothetical protein VJ951_07880, partial [Bacteroidales bacterium]|nr:hypothetical protein [Bacteroidales bacterium]